jgi:hypothetical protein
MATTIQHNEASVGAAGEGVTRAVPGDDGQPMASHLTTEQVWRKLAKASFAVLSHVTPAGQPRSSGVVYQPVGRRLYVAVAPDNWKARHIVAGRRVAVTRAGAPGRDPVVGGADPARNRQLPRHGGRPPGGLVGGRLAAEGVGVASAGRAAGFQLHHRGHPEGEFLTTDTTAWASRCCTCTSLPRLAHECP